MDTLSPDTLQAMTDAIVATARPTRVILFGSRASGAAHDGSDVDLLVVEAQPFADEKDRLDEMVRLWEVLAPFRVPTDLLLFSEAEVARWRTSTNHVLARAVRSGRVLYERGPNG
jgi:predicted nucleotidyltransferase